MTLPEEQSRYVYKGPYSVGDTAPIPFTYAEPEHVKALRDNRALELNVEYSVMGQNVTMLVPIASAENLVIYRETPLDNDAEFPQEAAFNSEKINNVIDKLTMQNQEQEEALGRALKLPIDAPTDIKNLDLPLPEPNKGLKWNEEGNGLVNTKYDTDAIGDLAKEQADIATQQAAIATTKANEAAASAALAAQKAEETAATAEEAIQNIKDEVTNAISQTEEVKEAAQQAIKDAKDAAVEEVNNTASTALSDLEAEITEAKDQAIAEVEESSVEVIAEARKWAIGTKEECPEGSAEWWAKQAAQVAQGEAYTKLETDALLAAKADKFTVGNTLTLSEEKVLGVNIEEINKTFPTKTEVAGQITAASSTKQDVLTAGAGIKIEGTTISADVSSVDAYTKSETNNLLAAKQNKLIAGSNIAIDPETNTISATGGAGDAYSKEETNTLLQGKQDRLIAGTGINIDGSTISSTIDTYNRTEIQGLIDTKQNKLTAGNYIQISGNTISATPEDMIQTFSEIDWNGLDEGEKAKIKLALIYE